MNQVTCPTCGSADRAIKLCATHGQHRPSFGDRDTCTNCSDGWHNRAHATLDITDHSYEFRKYCADHNITFTILRECFNGWTAEFEGRRASLEAMIHAWWGDPCDIYLAEIKDDTQ